MYNEEALRNEWESTVAEFWGKKGSMSFITKTGRKYNHINFVGDTKRFTIPNETILITAVGSHYSETKMGGGKYTNPKTYIKSKQGRAEFKDIIDNFEAVDEPEV